MKKEASSVETEELNQTGQVIEAFLILIAELFFLWAYFLKLTHEYGHVNVKITILACLLATFFNEML